MFRGTGETDRCRIRRHIRLHGEKPIKNGGRMRFPFCEITAILPPGFMFSDSRQKDDYLL